MYGKLISCCLEIHGFIALSGHNICKDIFVLILIFATIFVNRSANLEYVSVGFHLPLHRMLLFLPIII